MTIANALEDWRSGLRFVGAALILAVCVASAAAPLLSRFDPSQSGVDFLAPPSSIHELGTDELGRDVLSRLLYGGRASLLIGFGAGLIATLIGVPIGLISGYVGGRLDALSEQVINLFIALPGLVVALMIMSVAGATLTNLVLILGLVSWPPVARVARVKALVLREALFMEAARAGGGNFLWILRKHIAPNARAVIAAQFSLVVAYAIFTAASLSFLGLGPPPPTPDWGGMVRSGIDFLNINPSMSLAPSIAVGVTVLGFYSMGVEP